jgi:hypothetical protein
VDGKKCGKIVPNRAKRMDKTTEIKEIIREILQEESKPILEAKGKFSLSNSQYNQLDSLISKFGGDIESITESTLEEVEAKTVEIDPSVLDNLETFIQSGLEAKSWYEDMNNKIMGALGESDGCLFLILMAIFSPQNALAQNFRLAAQVYVGLKKDLGNPKSKKLLEDLIDEKSIYRTLKDKQKISFRNIFDWLTGQRQYAELKTVQGLVTGAKSVNAYAGNLGRVLNLYKQHGYTFTKSDVVDEMSKYITKKGTLGKNALISADKVFSFTLNLLDPNFEFETGWMPVTIDTWMASFFLPELSSKEKAKVLAKSQNYAKMADMVQKEASKYGMRPLELQAVIWVAMIKSKKGEKYSVNFDSAINKNLKKLNLAKDEIEKMSGVYSKIIQVIGAI